MPEIQYKLNSGEFFDKTEQEKVPTVDEYAKVSFEIHRSNRRELTHQKYLQTYDLHLKKTFGNKRLDHVKVSDIALWQKRLSDRGISAKRIKSVRTILNTIFDDAYRDELINRNPVSLVRVPSVEEIREKKPFSLEEIVLILKNIPESMQAFFAVGFFTGMRTGEIIGLKWSDVDFEERTIHIQRSRRQGTETLPKTKSSIRKIEILDVLMPYLTRHLELHPDTEYIFTAKGKVPFNTCAKIASWYWKPTLENLGIEYRNLYQMRHTFASLMISNGEDILWVSSMLGHKDSSMTLQKYARHIKQAKKKRAAFLAEIA